MDFSIVSLALKKKKKKILTWGRRGAGKKTDSPTQAKGVLWSIVLTIWLSWGHKSTAAGGRLRTRAHLTCSHELPSTVRSSSPRSMRYCGD